MVIPIRYKYKNYPLAPKATQKSKSLGILTSVVALAVWSFFFVGIFAYVLEMFGIEYNTAMIVGIVLLIPYIYGILRWKKFRISKIEKYAKEETKQNIRLIDTVYKSTIYLTTPFTRNEVKEKCKGNLPNDKFLDFALQQLVVLKKLKKDGKGKNTRYYRI